MALVDSVAFTFISIVYVLLDLRYLDASAAFSKYSIVDFYHCDWLVINICIISFEIVCLILLAFIFFYRAFIYCILKIFFYQLLG